MALHSLKEMETKTGLADMFAVMYHYIHPVRNHFIEGLKALSIEDFVLQLDYLEKNFTIIRPGDFREICEQRKATSKNFVLLTFDDGYSDIYKYVLPELRKRNLKAFFYIPDYFKKNRLLDVNAIHVLLTKEPLIPDYISHIRQYVNSNCNERFDDYASKVNYCSRYDSEQVQLMKQLLQFLLPVQHRKSLINELIETYSGSNMKTLFNQFYCSKQMLNSLIDEGMHIGGHGVDHVWLNTLSVAEQDTEIKGSIEFLKTLSHQDFYSFCYPFGGYDNDTLKLVEQYDFSFAFTTRPRHINLQKDSVFEIPRLDTNDVYPKSPAFKPVS